MAKEFKLQDPGEGIHEAEIQEVRVSPGDQVEEGDIVLVVETDKAAVEIPSPYTGTVKEIMFEPGDMATVGDVLMTFDGAEEEAEAKTREPEESEEEEAEEEEDEEEEYEEEKEEEEEEEERAEKERDEKKKEERKAAKREKEKAEKRAPDEKRPAQKAREGPVPAAPATRRLAKELGVDLAEIEGSGPEGRVTDEDVRARAGARKEEKPPKRKEARREAPLPDFERWGEVERRPLRSVRRAMAKRMAQSWAEAPHVTHQDKVDITDLEAFRLRHAADIEARGGKLTFTIFALKAVVAALKEHPRFNASLDEESEELILKHYYHLGVAVDTERGLLVPVIRDVDRKSVTELAVEFREIAGKARSGELPREAMTGGTFTITNVGPLGGTNFTPIINYPELAILGMAKARLEPVVRGDLENYEIVPRLMLPLCLTFDHRAIDGADAARFTATVMDTLADLESFMLMM